MGVRDAWRALWGQKASTVGYLLAQQRVGQPVRMEEKYEGFAREGFKGNVVARACIERIARSAASVDLLVYRGDTETPESPLAKQLARPNPWQGGASFFEAAVAYYLIAGDAFLEAVGPSDTGEPVELYALRPDRVEIEVGETGGPSAYVFRTGQGSRRFPVDPITGKSALTHWRSFNPLSEWRGLSAIASAALSVDQHNAAGVSNLALLQNHCRPPGVLTFKGDSLTEAQVADIRNDMEERFTGPRNAGRPPVLPQDFEWRNLAFSPADMEWLEGRNNAARDICQAFNYPPMLLGIPGDNTYSNYREARAALWEDTVLPLLDSLLDELNHALSPRFGDGYRIAYDADTIPALAYRRSETWTRVATADFLTPNEKREAVGYDEIEGGDKLLVPATMLPVDFDPSAVSEDGMKAWLIAHGHEVKEAERVASLAFRGDAP